HETMSPSMDILISSNLERLLYMLGGSELTKDLMRQLSENGVYTAPDALMEKLRGVFSGYWCSEEETADSIRFAFEKIGYLADPHTAVGFGAVLKYRGETGDETPTVLASTASPFKFPADVLAALGASSPSDEPADLLGVLQTAGHSTIPKPLAKVLTLPVRFTGVTDKEEMPKVVFGD
ncbi:MAG: threonine synthase, partial [Clostridia bacterium]|nr:threonine synthase [Clostridia bacterium]